VLVYFLLVIVTLARESAMLKSLDQSRTRDDGLGVGLGLEASGLDLEGSGLGLGLDVSGLGLMKH